MKAGTQSPKPINEQTAKMQNRNAELFNSLMALGPNGDISYRGKGIVQGVKAQKKADFEDYWPVDKEGLIPRSTQEDNYKGYTS